MIIPFDDISKSARVWIYQASELLDENQANIISQQASSFLTNWAAHGQPLTSSFKIVYDKFLVVAVDEQFHQASGCSIDASVALVKSIENELNINFFDRTQVTFLVNGEVFDSKLVGLKELVEAGKIEETTLTFNNLISNVGQMENEWIVEAGKSWLKRYF